MSIALRDLFRNISSIYDGAFCENNKRLKPVNNFQKKFHRGRLTRPKYVYITPHAFATARGSVIIPRGILLLYVSELSSS